MPTNEEVKVPEGANAAQHRFRLSLSGNPSDLAQETSPSLSATSASYPASRPPQDNGNGPFHLPYRNSRYKEKFQALREKYDRVLAKQAEYLNEYDTATAKIKQLQAENDLLLDAMYLAAQQNPQSFGLNEPPTADTPLSMLGDIDALHNAPTGTGAIPLSAGPHVLHAAPPPAPMRNSSLNGNGHVPVPHHVTNGTRSGNGGFMPLTNGHPPPPLHMEHTRPPSMEFIQHEVR
ncbi:hypothetical protein FB45DRAFT_926498 [Roridomyces roridus]|uniref:Uncharacterized protein n=1 Tax=Roridomyces roridus TaxID=1738132 RepID=A0AAD7BL23_9AGAR|nr:hypothetical protein FB45DRAFT_926498 [Roridomyces roridus]